MTRACPAYDPHVVDAQVACMVYGAEVVGAVMGINCVYGCNM